MRICENFVSPSDGVPLVWPRQQRAWLPRFGIRYFLPGVFHWPFRSSKRHFSHNSFRDVAVRTTDGAAFLVGWTHEDFVEGTINTRADIAGVLIETGAEPLAPTPAIVTPAPAIVTPPSAPGPSIPPPSPASSSTSCGATESFMITSADLPVEGCYQKTAASYATGSYFEVWSVSGTLDFDQVFVIGTTADGAEETVSHWGAICRRSWQIIVRIHPSDTSDSVSVVLRTYHWGEFLPYHSWLVGAVTILPLYPRPIA